MLFEQLIVDQSERKTLAVAVAQDTAVLHAAMQAQEKGIADVLLSTLFHCMCNQTGFIYREIGN